MRVAYVSGPMAGMPDLNGALFRAAERKLSSRRGLPLKKFHYDKVIVPHDLPAFHHTGECPPSYVTNDAHSAACYLREDIIQMLALATDVWMLPGWEASVGARLEMQVAAACGLGIKFFHAQELGCAHNEYGSGMCEEPSCWNHRRGHGVSKDELAAIRRPGEPIVMIPKGDLL